MPRATNPGGTCAPSLRFDFSPIPQRETPDEKHSVCGQCEEQSSHQKKSNAAEQNGLNQIS